MWHAGMGKALGFSLLVGDNSLNYKRFFVPAWSKTILSPQ